MATFNLKKLDKEQYHVEVSNRFATLGNLDAEVDFNRAREIIGENTKFQPRNWNRIVRRRMLQIVG
jgi:hypothetical protein